MIWIILGSTTATLLFCGLLFFGFRFLQNSNERNFQLLKERFDGSQHHLLSLQQQSDQAREQQAQSLRQELSRELQSNRLELQKGLHQSSSNLDQKVSQMDQRLEQRLTEMQSKVQDKLELNVKEGFRHFEKVQDQLKATASQLQNLNAVGSSINDLNSLLKLPHLRGNFGESSLERLLSDTLASQAYELQYTIVPGSSERVDAVIKYPNHVLPIDSKFPRETILPLFETNDPRELEKARKSLEEVIKNEARKIKTHYVRPDHGTTEIALMFVPSETIYFEILRNLKLCEHLSKQKIFIVSPNTLAITIHSISMARDYYEMAKGVEETLQEVKKAQKHFDHFEKRFQEVGKSIHKAQNAFDTASTHMGRYRSAANRLVGSEDLPSLNPTQERLSESTL